MHPLADKFLIRWCDGADKVLDVRSEEHRGVQDAAAIEHVVGCAGNLSAVEHDVISAGDLNRQAGGAQSARDSAIIFLEARRHAEVATTYEGVEDATLICIDTASSTLPSHKVDAVLFAEVQVNLIADQLVATYDNSWSNRFPHEPAVARDVLGDVFFTSQIEADAISRWNDDPYHSFNQFSMIFGPSGVRTLSGWN